ncbi:MAG: DUF3365 domain-containing protein [Dissulfurispiraceae bacterium]|jgi:signal transduction histidine kinase|nr:DUF3365 domain-containing protein [Dissulfurispiraceae bacterium]
MKNTTETQNNMSVPLNLKLIFGCCITLLAALGISFYVIETKQERLIMTQVENEARVIFQQIVITRKWIADHGGIFVEKMPWKKPSPYIKHSLITDRAGVKYLKETPAMVTKELSTYAKDQGLYWFHITSLKLTNPANAPDDFESSALKQFESSSKKEIFTISDIDSKKYLRFISPLFIEQPCLSCHSHQGYKIGDVRGAISITIPIDKTLTEIAENKKNMFVAGTVTIGSLMLALFLMMKKLVLTPVRKLKSFIRALSEGRYSRDKILQTGDEFEDLSRSFSDMAGKLSDYHDSLNDKIRAATKDIELTNKKLTEANTMLNELNIRKSDFIARASHELRTPLTSIKGAMDFVSARLSFLPAKYNIDKNSVADIQIFLEIINKNSERLIRMVNDMLDLERIEAGSSELFFSAANINSLLSETLTYFQVEAAQKNIGVKLNAPVETAADIDEDRIRQVLINLISNALKISPQNSVIQISVSSDNSSATVAVADQGPGVPLQYHEKIFEKFFKVGSKKDGSGLGLAVCKSIVEAHGGTIWVQNNEPEGAVFCFRIPVLQNNKSDKKEICAADAGI